MKAAKAGNCQRQTLNETHGVRKLKFTPLMKKEDWATLKDADLN